MDDTTSVKSGSPGGTTVSSGSKRKRAYEVKFYAVRVGYQPGVYHTWADCLRQVKGFKKAMCRCGKVILIHRLTVLRQSNLSPRSPMLSALSLAKILHRPGAMALQYQQSSTLSKAEGHPEFIQIGRQPKNRLQGGRSQDIAASLRVRRLRGS